MNSRIRFLPRRPVCVGLVATLVASAALTLAAPAPASAAVLGLELVTANTPLNSEVYKSVTVNCPPGKQIVGTGYWLAGAPGSVVLDDLIPTATSLIVGAGEVVGEGEPSDGTKQDWVVQARALCAFPLPGLQVGSQTSLFTIGGSRTVTAECPREKKVVGAGASLAKGFGQISIDALEIGDTSVTASGGEDEDGYTGEWSITAYAICADPIPGLTGTSVFTSSSSDPSREQTVDCPTGTRALGGGWSNHGYWAGQVYVTGISTQTDRVTVAAHADANGFFADGDDTWPMFAQVICAPFDLG